MPDLNYRQAKIAQRQHAMSFRDFVMHVVSRRPLTFYKNHGVFSHFPPDSTIKTVDFATFSQERSNYTIYGKDWDPSYDFFSQLRAL
jgi:hypothetical protein